MSTTLYGQYDLERGISDNISLESGISLTDEQDEHSELQVHKVHGELLQMNRLKGIVTRHAIVNNCYLLIRMKTMFSRREYWVHLGYLRNKPERRIILAWRWLAAAAGFALVTTGTCVYVPTLDFPYNPYIFLGILFGGTVLAAASLLPLFYQSRYRHVYCSRTGNVPLVELLPGRPDRKQYRQFKELLETYIARARKGLKPNNLLAGEVREHRRLFEAGMLDRKGYDRAKAVIFRAAGKHR